MKKYVHWSIKNTQKESEVICHCVYIVADYMKYEVKAFSY